MTSDVARAEARIRRVLAAKNVGAADYWRTRGRERFARELAEDALTPAEVAALLDRIEREQFPPVDLDEILREMKERVAQSEWAWLSGTKDLSSHLAHLG